MTEFKEALGLKIYKDGRIENKKSGREIGYINTSGELEVYVPEKKKGYKVSILMITVWKNNGILPEIPKKWKIIYKDGNHMNCHIDNLDYVDTNVNTYISPESVLRDRLKKLNSKKACILEELVEIEKEIISITSKLKAKNNKIDSEAISKLNERKKKRYEEIKSKKSTATPKRKGRPFGKSFIYLVDKYSQDYFYISPAEAGEKLGIHEDTASAYARKSMIVPGNPRYALTKNLCDTWDLLRRY